MFKTLDEEIKMTSRRVNALECVVIPRLEDTMAWIKGEMDEMEREEFFRVKKIVDKKKAKKEAEKEALLKLQLAAGGESPGGQQQASLLRQPIMPQLGQPKISIAGGRDKDV